MSRKYEYDIYRSMDKQTMDRLGKEGWELCAVSEGIFYFKREIISVPEKKGNLMSILNPKFHDIDPGIINN